MAVIVGDWRGRANATHEPHAASGDNRPMTEHCNIAAALPRLAAEDPDRRAGYAAFGRVVEGQDVIRAIFDAPIDPEAGEGWMKGQMLADPVKIVRASRVAATD